MDCLKTRFGTIVTIIVIIMVTGSIFIFTLSAHSHGGKTHGGKLFSAFQALQEASNLYDRLIISGKLSEDWETGLKVIRIDTRIIAENPEYVVQFEKAHGEPNSVFFFFNQNGEYSGSNFTGE